MVQYYWNPNQQQQRMQNPYMQPMQMQQGQPQMIPPPVTLPSGAPAGLPGGEQSYIENILRLNIGEPGVFHFSFSNTRGNELNTRNIAGYVEAAGRDHVIVHESSTGHQFLFPMIYFDYTEFEGQVNYFPQTMQSRQI